MMRPLAAAIWALYGLQLPTRPAGVPPPLPVAVEDAADPWSREDGTGFANDVVRAAFREAGVDIEVRVVPYARCRSMVIDGTVAACFSMSPSPDLKGSVVFSVTPIFQCVTVLVQNGAHPLAASTLGALPRGTVVGTVLGYEYPIAVSEARRSGAIVLEESASEALVLRKLAAGRVHAALVNVNESKPLEFVRSRARVSDGVEQRSRVGTLNSYIGFSVRHPRGAWARDRFDEGMRRLQSKGEMARLVRAWADTARAVVNAQRAPSRPVP